jgi:hypothetical protein
MKNGILPIPVDAEIHSLIKRGAEVSGLKQADVMRQGLRHGVPAFIQKIKMARLASEPKCLAYLDDYRASSVPAKGYKKALRAKLLKKYGGTNR